VAGTTSGKDSFGKVIAEGDLYGQACAALEKIKAALDEAGASLKDVIRTRTLVTDITRFDEIARAHSKYFGDIRPAATLVEVSALVEPGFLVEIEADAVIE